MINADLDFIEPMIFLILILCFPAIYGGYCFYINYGIEKSIISLLVIIILFAFLTKEKR